MVDNIDHAAPYKGNRYLNKNTIRAITCALSGLNEKLLFSKMILSVSKIMGSVVVTNFFVRNGEVADLFCYWPAVTSTFKSHYNSSGIPIR